MNEFNGRDVSPLRNPLVVALDVDSAERALSLARSLKDIAGGFKLGPRLCLRYGMGLVKEIAQLGPVFMDNKHLDIPSTMEAAVRASFDAGASLLTVHVTSGREALLAMAKLEQELNKVRPFRILAVTILTSWGRESMPPNFQDSEVSEQVLSLVRWGTELGIRSFVCSPQEASLILQNLQNAGLYLVTPGIRTSMDAHQDQKRAMGPQEALRAGASAIVVGRPIIEAADPVAAAISCLNF